MKKNWIILPVLAALFVSGAASGAKDKVNSAAIDKARTALGICYLRNISNALSGTMALANCMAEGLDFCNTAGMKTDPKSVKVSPVTGRIMMDNGNCAFSLDGEYRNAEAAFQLEYETYARYESAGEQYKPLQFDIREYLHQ